MIRAMFRDCEGAFKGKEYPMFTFAVTHEVKDL